MHANREASGSKGSPPHAPGVCGSMLLGATDRWSQSPQLRGAQSPAVGEILQSLFPPCRVTRVYKVQVSYLGDSLLITQVWPALPRL